MVDVVLHLFASQNQTLGGVGGLLDVEVEVESRSDDEVGAGWRAEVSAVARAAARAWAVAAFWAFVCSSAALSCWRIWLLCCWLLCTRWWKKVMMAWVGASRSGRVGSGGGDEGGCIGVSLLLRGVLRETWSLHGFALMAPDL